jgi:putative glutamine amidotransferase
VRPIIGLTTYRTRGQMTIYDGELASLPAQYLDTVSRSGGLGVMLPPQQSDGKEVDELVRRLDGLIVTGGSDLNPSRYGQELSPAHEGFDDARDEWEDTLLRAAFAQEIPVLGICRGAQMINVHCGGTLHQHLPEVVGHDRYRKPGQSFTPEPITVSPNTLLATIFRGDDAVSGMVQHHQAIDTVGEGLVLSACGFDGTVQGIERPGGSWCVAVQWHPEEDASDDRLVRAFVEECVARRG